MTEQDVRGTYDLRDAASGLEGLGAAFAGIGIVAIALHLLKLSASSDSRA